MIDDEITTEELLNMRVVPEQRAELAALQEALGTNPRPSLTSTNQTLDGLAARVWNAQNDAAWDDADDETRKPWRAYAAEAFVAQWRKQGYLA